MITSEFEGGYQILKRRGDAEMKSGDHDAYHVRSEDVR